MSKYLLAHIELPIELFPDGTHKIYNDRSNIYFEVLHQLPPIQENKQVDLNQMILSLSSTSIPPKHTKIQLEETNGDNETIVFKNIDSSEPTTSLNTIEKDDGENTNSFEKNYDEEEYTNQYKIWKQDIQPRRPKSAKYTFRVRPKLKSSLYSRRSYPSSSSNSDT